MARFILVHGAWHGGWCWEEIAPRLNALGHDVRAPDLPGMGSDVALGHVATLEEWAAFIAGMASAQDEPAILVGHSQGGIVVSRAAELAPKAVRRLVYLAAVMAMPGESMADLFDKSAREHASELAEAMSLSADGRTVVVQARDIALRAFYGATPPDRAQAAFSRLTPQPSTMRTAPIQLSDARYGGVPRSYIYCEQDQALPPDLQRHMVARQPCEAFSLQTDHSPFYSVPDDLTALLQRIATS